MEEWLHSKYEALSSNTSATEKEKKKKEWMNGLKKKARWG
jgi:hypothetical protein